MQVPGLIITKRGDASGGEIAFGAFLEAIEVVVFGGEGSAVGAAIIDDEAVPDLVIRSDGVRHVGGFLRLHTI